MEKVVIDAGWANGWSNEQTEFCNKIIDLLSKDPNTVKTGRSLGNCASETTWDNGKFRITWKVDSSD